MRLLAGRSKQAALVLLVLPLWARAVRVPSADDIRSESRVEMVVMNVTIAAAPPGSPVPTPMRGFWVCCNK
jgi:hypothetical protein